MRMKNIHLVGMYRKFVIKWWSIQFLFENKICKNHLVTKTESNINFMIVDFDFIQ